MFFIDFIFIYLCTSFKILFSSPSVLSFSIQGGSSSRLDLWLYSVSFVIISAVVVALYLSYISFVHYPPNTASI